MLNRAILVSTKPIIVVENDADLSILLRHIIEQTYPSMSIVLASMADAAVQIYTQRGAELAVIDHQFPTLDGLALARQLRSWQARLPIVLLASDDTVKQAALAYGVTEFVAKPFGIDELVHSLVSALPYARMWPC